MKKTPFATLAVLVLLTAGCTDKDQANTKRTFMFWCHRQEVQSANFQIPKLETPAQAAYIRNRLKAVHGYVDSSWNLETRTFTVSYKSTDVRKMNFEEAIALAGFAVNNRPANPKAKIPAGVQ